MPKISKISKISKVPKMPKVPKKKKRVLVFGTFDLFHKGHEFFLKHSAKYGELWVVVALDDTVKKLKGRLPVHSQEERLKKLNSLKYVKKAVLGNVGDKLKVVEEIKPDIICLGYDQTFFTESLKERLAERGVFVDIYGLSAYKPEKFKTSRIREKNGL